MNLGKTGFFIFGFLLLSNALAWLIVLELSRNRGLEVIFFDIGQGDSIFIETPKRHQVLIDGGPSSAILEKLDREMPFWDNTIDLIILTHPEKDHLRGLLDVLKRYRVENILWTGIVRDTAEFRQWQKEISEEKANIIIARAGQKIIASKAVLEILHPFENLSGQELKDSNNTGVVCRLVFGENSFLFTADVYKSVESKLIKNGASLDSDILKAGHHGSKTSTSNEFVEKVSPDVAVISAGKGNSYGHPEVLDILENYGIRILRTDLQGDIKIISDGNKYAISSFQN
jgi:competence protein ComEC